MALPMVKIEGVPDARDAVPGMASFAGSGPREKTCGDCMHRGYLRQSSNGRWDAELQQTVFRDYRVQKCAMFKKMTGRHGPDIGAENKACKYFEAKPK